MLILAVRLLNVNQLLCPEWVSDTVPLSAQYVNENHVLSVSSLCAVGSWIMNESQREQESRPHSFLRAGKWVPTRTVAASFAEDSQVSHGSSTPGRHARSWAQLNRERNESVHEVIPFTSFTPKMCSFEWHVRDRHNTTISQMLIWMSIIMTTEGVMSWKYQTHCLLHQHKECYQCNWLLVIIHDWCMHTQNDGSMWLNVSLQHQ